MTYLLDTDTVSYALRGMGGVNDRLRTLSPTAVTISSITEAELWFGVEKRGSRKLRELVANFIRPLDVIPFDGDSAARYGKIVAKRQRAGLPIDMADAMIAAVAVDRKLILVTNNAAHFAKIDDIQLENWL